MTGQERPNLLYIHSDQHNPFVTGCYGDPLIATPNLDRLARSGTVFDAAYCASPICVPSRMAMLTGQHPYENQVWTNRHSLDSSIPTLAHAMGAAGYAPVLVGRMHSMGPDQLRGYTRRLIGDHTENYLGGTPPARGVLDGTAQPQRVSLRRSGAGQSAYQVHDEDVTAAAVNFLNAEGSKRQVSGDRTPFNLTVGYMLPHAPYVARQEDFERYLDRMTMPANPGPGVDERHPHLRWWRNHSDIEDVSAEEVLRARAAYWALVDRLDAMIGEIMHALAANGLEDNTLIVYTSDHGDSVGEHGLWWKHTFYEASVRVPLIVSWPGRLPAGRRCERVVSALDVTATMLDALGAPSLPNASGRSLLPLLDGSDASWDDLAFSEYCSDEYGPEGGCYQRMIRRGAWKLVYYHGMEPQLFNLAEDPDERVDRATDPSCQDLRRELTARVLDGWDPERVRATMLAKWQDSEILAAWARNTKPANILRWDMRPEMSYLDP